jgi:hypothetical protein
MSGQETVSTIRALLRGIYGVTTDDQFTLPTRFIPNKLTAVAVNSITDEKGPLYEEVKF